MPKMLKTKKKVENDRILLKFSISNISILKKKTIVLHNFLIKSQIRTTKQYKKFIFFKTIDR